MSNKKLKGFTLIELIIVMAIFGVIMFAAMQLLSPIGNVFNSTVQNESTTASIDNLKRYLNGTLAYADRTTIYIETKDESDSSGDFSEVVEISDENIKSSVAKFAGYYFCDKDDVMLSTHKTPIQVLYFNNDDYTIYKYTFYPHSSTTSSGSTSQYSWYDSVVYDEDTNTYSLNKYSMDIDYPINSELASDYGFKVYLGSYEYLPNDSGDALELKQESNYNKTLKDLDSSNVCFTIDSYKRESNGSIDPITDCLQQSSTLSFSLVNQLDSSGNALFENIQVINTEYGKKSDAAVTTDASGTTVTTTQQNLIISSSNPLSRFFKYPSSDSDLNKIKKDSNFYIVYTLPERADEYRDNNKSLKDVTTAATTTATSTT